MAETMKARTDYDYAHLVDIHKVSAKTRDKKWIMIRRGIVLAAAVVCAGVGVSVLAQRDGDMKQAGIYLLIGLILLGVFFFFPHFSAWRTKGKIGKNPKPDLFVFGDDNVEITRGEQTVSYPYHDCNTLLETELAFYLYHHRGQGLVISKKQIEGGTHDDLRTWLEKKCGIKTDWIGDRKAEHK